MALTQIKSEGIKDSEVKNADMADDAVGIAELSATGTASSSTFLRGDNSWQAISTTTEGTAVLSTGETGTAKFLRVDGDDSCSWQVPPDTNTTYSVGDGGLTQNNFTNTLKTKLDGIATSANNYVHPNHSGEVTSTADGATVIADDTVDEANLKISNAGSNGQFLQKQSGNTGGLTWANAGNVLQVKIDTQGNTDIQSSYSSSTLTDMNSVTITPVATSSKFLVWANFRGYKNGNGDLALKVGVVRNVDGGSFQIQDSTNSYANRFVIDSSGKVYIGTTTSHAGKFIVKDTDNSGNQIWVIGRANDNTGSISFRNNGDAAYTGRIQAGDTNGMESVSYTHLTLPTKRIV